MQNNISSEMQRSNLRLRVEESSRYGVLSELPVVFLPLILKTIADSLSDISCISLFVMSLDSQVGIHALTSKAKF